MVAQRHLLQFRVLHDRVLEGLIASQVGRSAVAYRYDLIASCIQAGSLQEIHLTYDYYREHQQEECDSKLKSGKRSSQRARSPCERKPALQNQYRVEPGYEKCRVCTGHQRDEKQQPDHHRNELRV